MAGPHGVVRDTVRPHGANPFESGPEEVLEGGVDVAVGGCGQRGAAVDEQQVADESRVPFGDQFDDEGAHRMAEQHQRPAELVDDRRDVGGVLPDAVGGRCIEAAATTPQVHGDQFGGPGEVVRERIPHPGVRGDAVHGHDRRRAAQTSPPQRPERGALHGEVDELSACCHRPPGQHAAWSPSTLCRSSCPDRSVVLSAVRAADRGPARRGCCA